MLDDLKAELEKAQGMYQSAVEQIHKKLQARVAGNQALLKDARKLQKAFDVHVEVDPVKPLTQPAGKGKK